MPKVLQHTDRRGPLYMWAVMQRLTAAKGCFTVAEIHSATRGIKLISVRGYLARLRKKGAIVIVGARTTSKSRQAITFRTASPTYPEQRGRRPVGVHNQQAWTALRALKGNVTARDLALNASTDEVEVKEASLSGYLRSLARNGIIHVDRSARTHRYRLLPSGNLGPKAPVMLEKGGYYDPNKGEIVNVTGRAAA